MKWNSRSPAALWAIVLLAILTLPACSSGSGSGNDAALGEEPPPTDGGGSGTTNSAPTIAGSPPASIAIGENYSFQPEASDPDGDALTFDIRAKPEWATFDAATGGVSGTPQSGDEGSYDDISIVVSDGSATDSLTFAVTVNQEGGSGSPNNPPSIAGTPPASVNVGVNYSFQPEVSDLDGDTLTLSIQAKPSWADFNSETGALSGTPQEGDEGPYEFISILVSDGSASDSLDFGITVNPADGGGGSGSENNAPTITGSPPGTVTVGENYSFQPAASDADGDALSFSIQAKPSWASFNSATGGLSGAPQPGDEGSYDNISVEVSDGSATSSLDFAITVNPAGGGGSTNNAPIISGTAPASITVGQDYSFQPAASDPDGDALTFSIQAKPSWASFNSASGGLSGVPQPGDEGSYDNISIEVSDGSATSSLDFAITVNPAGGGGGGSTNNAPTISGTPPPSITVGESYSFQPAASDPDGDTLTFSIEAKPSWASFNSATGRLNGTPQTGDEGSYDDIAIVVSDGSATDSLDFAVTVNPAGGGGSANNAPTISGSPQASIKVGENYSFQPAASDPDGDALVFSIEAKPSWANFNSATGRLSGTPGAGDEGTYDDISIVVSDGSATDSLGFAITVNQVALGSVDLSWTPPTLNTDGSALTDLTTYKIYYGTTRGNYTEEIPIDNPSVTTYRVENLSADTYYFVVTATNSTGVESDFSGVLVQIVD